MVSEGVDPSEFVILKREPYLSSLKVKLLRLVPTLRSSDAPIRTDVVVREGTSTIRGNVSNPRYSAGLSSNLDSRI